MVPSDELVVQLKLKELSPYKGSALWIVVYKKPQSIVIVWLIAC